MPGSALHERHAELAALDAAIADAAGGTGRVVLLEGPAGIGKTALLETAREHAIAAGLRPLGARASTLDRDFPYGVVHQLLDAQLTGSDPERRARLLTGAAALAEQVLAPAALAAGDQLPDHAAVHGLYWLLANLADEGPLLLCVDDLHWADRPSLRVLEYLGRRLDGLPVLVLLTARPDEPGAETELLGAIGAGPCAAVLRPPALTASATAALAAAVLGGEPEPGFVTACATATGGNPLLLRTLLARAAEAGLGGTDAEAGTVASLGAEGLSRLVARRLSALGREVTAFARAAAVLGERATFDDLAAVAGLDGPGAAEATDRLVAAQLLDRGTPAFVHPVVREAVLAGTPALERAALHRRAADRLRTAGARSDEVAAHLLATEPAGDAEVVAMLREAARSAAADGAPEHAVAALRRALAEGVRDGGRVELLVELGELESQTGAPEAIARLDEALAAGAEGDLAARAHAARGAQLIVTDPLPALDAVAHSLEVASTPALRRRLEALLLESATFRVESAARRAELLDRGRSEAEPSTVMLAHLAIDAGYRGTPAPEVSALAARALAGDELLRDPGPASNTFNLLVHALRYAERAEQAQDALDAGDHLMRRRGSRFQAVYLDHAWAYWHLLFGSVAVGLGHAESGLERTRDGFAVSHAAFAAIASELLIERDRLDDAAAVLPPASEELETTIVGPFVLAARGSVRALRQRREEAEGDLRRAVALLDRFGWRAPLVSGARLRLAELLADTGRGDEAAALADAAADDARAAETPGALGVCLRVRARAEPDPERAAALLEQAVATLAPTPLRREHGWALHDHGAALRRLGRPTEARAPLRAALDAALRTEAPRLARLAQEELAASGARPRRTALRGVDALTPSERRVANLAADGLTNREVAETLWITRKTVEVHLARVYAKLGISGRTQLPAALRADGQAADAA